MGRRKQRREAQRRYQEQVAAAVAAIVAEPEPTPWVSPNDPVPEDFKDFRALVKVCRPPFDEHDTRTGYGLWVDGRCISWTEDPALAEMYLSNVGRPEEPPSSV